MRDFFEMLRNLGLDPNLIQSRESTVQQFNEPKTGSSVLDPVTAKDMIEHWMAERDRPFKYSYMARYIEANEVPGVNEGIYCNTHIYLPEWVQSSMLKSAYTAIYTGILSYDQLLAPNQMVFLHPSFHGLGEERYLLLHADAMNITRVSKPA